MSANTYVGEVGITVGEREYLFRPSLKAIASLGSPREIIRDYLNAIQRQPPSKMSSNPWIRSEQQAIWQSRLHGVVQIAIKVIHACYVGEDDAHWRLTGFYKEHKGRSRWVMGLVPPQNLHVLGTALLVNGIIGKPIKRRGSDDGPATRFDPSEFVALAVAHLGMSPSESWDLTMVELQRALDAKFPPESKKGGEPLPEEDEHDLLGYVDKIRFKGKKRARQKI